jgi:hypothetical protein
VVKGPRTQGPFSESNRVACEGYEMPPFRGEKQHWLELLAPASYAGEEPILCKRPMIVRFFSFTYREFNHGGYHLETANSMTVSHGQLAVRTRTG